MLTKLQRNAVVSKQIPSSAEAKNWFYLSSFQYIVIHWTPENKESIKNNWDHVKSIQVLIWKKSLTLEQYEYQKK